ncbi:MAG: hypothetical protein ACJAS9_002288 [Polaribacter sp.]|jgi:hypothetical protein
MKKHTRMAVLVAPVLIILGYIASDYYLEQDALTDRFFQIHPSGVCNVVAHRCVFESGDFKLDLFDKEGKTTANATYPMDSVTLFMVDGNNESKAYMMEMVQSKYYWHVDTHIRENFENTGQAQKLRLIVKIKGGQYISEFTTSD